MALLVMTAGVLAIVASAHHEPTTRGRWLFHDFLFVSGVGAAWLGLIALVMEIRP
jgi:hypothetical protein